MSTLPKTVPRVEVAPQKLPINSVVGGNVLREFIEHDGCIATYRGHAVVSGQDLTIWELLPSRLVMRGPDQSVAPVSAERAVTWSRQHAAFARIGKALVAARHPNLAPAAGYVEARGTGYLLCNFDAGERLDARLTRLSGFTDLYLAELAVGLLQALQHLHANGLAHGDVREKNVYCQGDGTPVLNYSLSGISSNLNRLTVAGLSAGDGLPSDVELARERLRDLQALSAMLTRCAIIGRRKEQSAEPSQLLSRTQSLLTLIGKPLTVGIDAVNFSAEQWQQSFERLRDSVLVPRSEGARPMPMAPADAADGIAIGKDNDEDSIPPTVPQTREAAPPTAGHRRAVMAGLAAACALLVTALLWRGSASKLDAAGPDAAPTVIETTPSVAVSNQVAAMSSKAPAPSVAPVEPARDAVPALAPAPARSETAAETPIADSPAASAPLPATVPPPLEQPGVAELLTAATADLDARRLTVPAGNNAVERYRAVLKLEPGNADARKGLQRVVNILVARAEKQLAAGDFDATTESLRRARAVDPDAKQIAVVEQALTEKKRLAETPRIAQPYPPVFKSAPPAPVEAPAPPPAVTETSRAEELRLRLGGSR